PEVLAFISKGEALGLDREVVLKRMLVERAFSSDPHRRANELRFEVFEFFGLDPERPLHWRVLFNAMIEAGFKSSGAHPEWDGVGHNLRAVHGRAPRKGIRSAPSARAEIY